MAAVGTVNVPLNTMSTVPEAVSILERSGAVAVLCDPQYQQLADALAELAPMRGHGCLLRLSSEGIEQLWSPRRLGELTGP